MNQPLPSSDQLPYALYTAEQVRKLDACAIEQFGIPGQVLMQRAGEAAFALLRKRWPEAGDITVVCGIGNNGGDGFVVAKLAHEAGLNVRVLQVGDRNKLKGDALRMAKIFEENGAEWQPFSRLPPTTDVVVDGILGTGLEREVEGAWAGVLAQINRHPAPVLALDIPSGLNSDAGRIMGVAISAEVSISFIGLKRGMFTGQGPACCGDIVFNGLEVPAKVYASQIASARRMDWQRQSTLLAPRSKDAHKGDFGHVLVVGGSPGYIGAVQLAAEAAARAGAGLVSVATHPKHAALVNSRCPELMSHGISKPVEMYPLLKRVSVVVIGPGLGQSDWAKQLLGLVLDTDLPLVVDADGLNLLKDMPDARENWILTPHPGEAARLLGCTTRDIAFDRFEVVRMIQAKYGGVVLLKGAGTLVQDGSELPAAVCTDGNPGMASGGMGDVLSGVIGGLIAQNIPLADAAVMGACLHGAAGDCAAEEGEKGLLAHDLLPCIRRLLNP